MLYGIIRWVIISLILIMLVHHLFAFFKNTLTVPKVKDLVHKPSEQYKEINATLVASNNNTIKLSAKTGVDENTNKPDSVDMKNELKNFFKELNGSQLPTSQESSFSPY